MRLLVVLVPSLSLAAGCGLFKPRDPIGTPGETVHCRALTDPDSLVANMLQFYGNAAGVTCYTSMLGPTFQFHPDNQDSLETPVPFAGWDENVEAQATSYMVSHLDSLKAFIDSTYADPTIIDNPKTEIWYYHYHLLAWDNAASDTIRYQGLADITFIQSAGADWRISNWLDKRDGSGLPTWGRLRADNRVGF